MRNEEATSLAVVGAARWATLTVGLLLAVTTPVPEGAIYGAVLLAHALWRTARPGSSDRPAVLATVVDVALHLVVVGSTGWWRSPFVITLIGPITALAHAQAVERSAVEREAHAMGRLSRLTEANALLSELHRVSQSLPVSLDFKETVESTAARVRELFDPNSMALLLHDEINGRWTVAAATGLRLPSALATVDLPGPVATALTRESALVINDLAGTGMSPAASVGLYAPLWAREQLVGILVVERVVPGTLEERHRQLLEGIAEQAAMAIDNARWFSRLRRAGAEEERLRIARDLHDRVGQALAYTSFELDRIARTVPGDAVRDQLQVLRSDTRQILAEVRETLSDLRADVSEQHDLIATVDTYLERVRRRTDLDIAFEHGGRSRLPLPVEREMWRIAQEAVANVERHAQASHVKVSWLCAEGGALLEVADDGTGIAPERVAPAGSYGLLGMRERAEAIGAALEIDSTPGGGTTVRCRIAAA